MSTRTTDPLLAATAIYRLVPRVAFTALFAFITVRLLLQEEWFGGAMAGLLTVLFVFVVLRSWRALRMAMGRPPLEEIDEAVEAVEAGR
jgi:energy-coupling factor transporter transmembrane protein EcfT